MSEPPLVHGPPPEGASEVACCTLSLDMAFSFCVVCCCMHATVTTTMQLIRISIQGGVTVMSSQIYQGPSSELLTESKARHGSTNKPPELSPSREL